MLHLELQNAAVTVFIPGVILLGTGIGFLTGMFGVGGGFLLTPALNVFFGIPYPVAVGSGLAQIFVTGSASALKHHRRGNMVLRLGVVLATGSLVGTEIGKRIMDFLVAAGAEGGGTGGANPVLDTVMNLLFLVLMGGVMALILGEKRNDSESNDEVETRVARLLRRFPLGPSVALHSGPDGDLSIWVPAVIAVFVGVLTGLLGVGGGFVMFPLLVYAIGLTTTKAVGTSALQAMVATGYGAVAYTRAGYIDFPLVGMLLLGSLVGVQVGVYVVGKMKARGIRKYFAVVIGVGIVMVGWNLVRGFLR